MAREASPLTLAIRELLDKNKGNITHSEAVEPLKKLGHNAVDAVVFNGIKAAWKKKQEQGPTTNKKKATSGEVTADDAIAFVRENGGLASAKADVERRVALIEKFEAEIAALA